MVSKYVTTFHLTSDNHNEKAVSFNLLDFSMEMLKMNDKGLNECQSALKDLHLSTKVTYERQPLSLLDI